jgi:uncharacterized protein (UPF0276 family)
LTHFAEVNGVGLGLRRSLISQLQAPGGCDGIDFFELAPENWINLGGRYADRLKWFSDRFPIVCHGLSLNLGGQDPLDFKLLADVKAFLRMHNVKCYSEHLSFCGHGGLLYDLLPIPFTEEAVTHVAERIRVVQDFLEQPIAVENISYYLAPSQELTEIEFVNAVLREANCRLMLDINNVYVNSVNHCYDPIDFIAQLPSERIAYAHIAGHADEAEDLKVDTHGAPLIKPVLDLAQGCYRRFGAIPTVLERDFNFPPLAELKQEVSDVKRVQERALVELS